MKRLFAVFCVVALIFTFVGCDKGNTESDASKKPVENNFVYNTDFDGDYFTLRNGFSNAYNKLKDGKDITIAFLGGSITYGIGTSDLSRSFRVLVENWIEENYKVNVTGINAAIPSAASAHGAYCVDTDVLPKNPDIIFIEYAINDKYASSKYNNDDFSVHMETIVRKIRTIKPDCDIAFLYTTDSWVSVNTPLFEQAEVHEKVAEHYGVTTINIGYGLRKSKGLIKGTSTPADEGRWKQFFTDACHTADNGNKVYADIINECLEAGFKAAKDNIKTNKAMPKQLNDELLMDAKLIKTSTISLDNISGWQKSTTPWFHFDGYISTDSTDSEFVYTFEGTSFGIIGPVNTEYSFSVDGGEWTSYTFNTHPQPLVQGLKKGEHTIRIKGASMLIAALLVN
ncbi:MAG: SGNH/GDSL hydrolase family protein [Ruminococcaceae bacterium]|nr:SGNH/GDSL hydrolase family protein [Oscillospiraceae bacterium]